LARKREIEMDRIYFITHTNEKYSYIESAKLALDNGIRLIQLRMKHSPIEQIKQTAYELLEECSKYKACLIMNDNADLASSLGFDGVHIGQNDENIESVKTKIKDNQIVGLTCNNFEQIQQAKELSADYVGLGPFRFTQTKEKLSPILGIQGYKDIMQQCRQMDIELPIYAIGGIRLEDVNQIMETGVYGIAISSLILESSNPQNTIKELFQRIKDSAK
jgi:thiamine-phosphate pyrophosphorylase